MIKLIKSTFYNEKNTKQKLCVFIKNAHMLSIGKECGKFEHNFAKYQGRKHCVFVNSGSSANLAIIQALLNLGKIKKGDAVGFSALTWSTNVMPLIELGLQPVPIDCALDTLNVSSRILLKTIQKHPIKMLFLTNLLGFCDDIDEIYRICKKKDILLIEDNCESLGSVYKGKKLGNFGLASTFSFYVGHHMSTIEGGAVCTDNTELETMLQFVRAHGWDRNLTQDRQLKIRIKHHVNETFYSRYTFYDLGYNLRTTEIQGFVGNIQLSYLDQIVKKRQSNFFAIARIIYGNTAQYYPIRYDHMDIVSNFAVPIVCRTQKIRDDLVKKCNGLVEIRPIVGGDMTKQPFYLKYVNGAKRDIPTNANIAHEQGLYFGNNPELTDKEIKTLISIFS
ncbi:MAG: DegT/DnrJ/EryC1/StrS aminotransferase [Microgenomates group bacterium GW2011_GWC1_43_11]|uniref:DegT/DnrJ/EryC1/StrS aminotransferase n=2 Tax=Candidatus Gottesmaniibacteriota TaxID=1752720 RepID=A0A0G1IRT7_9BACT|nr:MAG: DegT/DnrJ/EryC1/StrS aminotransferase [Microgenomates group bacterium GW2011_GWC1_43_11]KKT39160.1 MAG: DegT/DnrJ/EryC1/StrS aminotransferase [Candidatus Gottesmanbacteria bacterium GW2011_GWB1_44_11c]KKT61633.1 MAG: DegT/DnrJ/EryC1/StrS aminotransferase [Candidatus Gottesmanbacteria bacterium GW2011_GWA1_44_24b]